MKWLTQYRPSPQLVTIGPVVMPRADDATSLIKEVTIELEIRTAIIEGLAAAFAGDGATIDRDWRRMASAGRAVLDRHLLGLVRRSTPITVVRKGIDVGSIPPTPASGFADDAVLAPLDAYLLALCSILRIRPVAYQFENGGRLARNVVPHPAFDRAESSWGSRTGLSWHQDNNFQPFEFEMIESRPPVIPPMPRFLAFLALRNHEFVPTLLLATTAVVDRLPSATRRQLQRSAFLVEPPENVSGTSTVRCSPEPLALLARCRGMLYSRFDATGGVRGVDEPAEEALELMRNAIQAASDDIVEITLSPGDAMIFDNYRVMHRRPSFEPCDLGEGRWLRRIYGLSDEGSDEPMPAA